MSERSTRAGWFAADEESGGDLLRGMKDGHAFMGDGLAAKA